MKTIRDGNVTDVTGWKTQSDPKSVTLLTHFNSHTLGWICFQMKSILDLHTNHYFIQKEDYKKKTSNVIKLNETC